MRTLSAFGVASLLLVSAVSAPAQDKTAAKVDYMPLKVGSKWTYKVDFGGMNISLSQKCTKIEKKGEHDVASLETEFNNMNIVEQTSSNAKGVFRHSFQGIPVDPPIQALRLPVKKGESWEGEINFMGQKMKATLKTEGEEEVTVPAGKYKAVIVSMEMEVMGQQIKAKNWFAPNVGIIKQSFDFGGLSGSSELEKFDQVK